MNEPLTNISIYDPQGNAYIANPTASTTAEKIAFPITDSCERSATLMGDDYVRLVFKLPNKVSFEAFSYIKYGEQSFFLKERYIPTPNGCYKDSSGVSSAYYSYDVKFVSVANMLTKATCYRHVVVSGTDGGEWNEPEININGTLETMYVIVVEAIHQYYERLDQSTYFSYLVNTIYENGLTTVGGVTAPNTNNVKLTAGTELVSFSFQGDNIANVCTTIANSYSEDDKDTEWYITEKNESLTLHFAKCEQDASSVEQYSDYAMPNSSADGRYHPFITGGLTKVEYAQEWSDIPQTIVPFGSERNMSGVWRKDTDAKTQMMVTFGKRLRLDTDHSVSVTASGKTTTYSNAYAVKDKSGNTVILKVNAQGGVTNDNVTTGIEQVKFYEDIYPQCHFRVTSVSVRNKRQDGETVPEYTIEAVPITSTKEQLVANGFYPLSIEEATTLSVRFESGLLNGREFEIANKAHKDQGATTYSLKFTIVADGSLEDGTLIPSGNFIPHGDDTKGEGNGDEFALFNMKMPQEYIEYAQQELAQQAYDDLIDLQNTRPEVKCTTDPVSFNGDLSFGQIMGIKSELFGGTANEFVSRVIAYSYKLTTPANASFSLASAVMQGTIASLNSAIANVTNITGGLGQRAINLSRRGWRDQSEMADMLDSLTAEMMLIGKEKYQFAYTSDITCVNNTTAASDGYMHFKGLQITYGSLQHTQEPYISYANKGLWEMPTATLTTDHNGETLNAATPYYLYAVVNNEDTPLQYELWANTDTDQADNENYLLLGILASEFKDNGTAYRIFNRTNGYTAINGGTITTEQLQDAGRNLIIDFQSNPPRIIARNGAEIIGAVKFKASDTQSAEEQLKALGLLTETAQSTADAANAAVAQVRTDYQAAIAAEEEKRSQAITNVQSSISGLQQQIDGEVTSWFLKGVPTTTNQPAADWTTDELKQRHEGDTYTNMLNAQADLSELSDNLPLWIEQGHLSVGTSYIGYTYEEQMRPNATVCRTKCIFNIVKGITIGAPPTGIQQLVILYDANKQYRSNTSWVTTSVSLDNYANTYKYFAIIYTVTGDGAYKTALAPSQLTTLSQTGELTTPDAGKSWRWCKGTADTPATTWHWHLIADSDAVKALVEAGKAQSTADGKSTTFVVKPTTYQKGDLWILQSDTDHTAGKKGDVLTANADSTTYTASHWSKEVKYTDDTAATAAKAAADAAQKAADAAQADATQALSDLEEVNKDGRVYISEMKQLSIELENIKQEKIQLVGTDGKGGEAQKWDASVDQTTYINAYNACVKALTYYTTESNATNGYITIITDTSNQYSWSKITAYYSARQVLANAIATAANSYSDSIKTTAEQAVSDAATAQTAADNAKSVADAATTRLNNWANDGVISPTEKQGIKDEIARIAADKTQITNEYTKYSMGTPTAYNTVYTNYNTVLGTLSATTPETIAIPSDFSTKQKGYYDQRTIALNAIAKKADEVAQAYADDAVNNMEIGGRNLLTGTSKEYKTVTTSNYGYNVGNVTATPNALYTYRAYVKVPADSTVSYGAFFTFWTKTSYKQYRNCDVKIQPNTEGYTTITMAAPADATRIRCDLRQFNASTGIDRDAEGLTIQVKEQKLEKGNKPTDWTPAPEDVDASIATAQSAADAAKQTLANIANDTIFTAQEKCTVKTEWASIQAEFNTNTTNASAAWGSSAYTSQTEYKVYKTAYDALNTYLTSTAQLNTATDTTIVAATFQSKFSDYYGANITLLNAIANQLAALEVASAVENINVGGENICTHDNPYTLTAGASANYMYTTLCSNLENGATYVFSCEKSELLAGTATQYGVKLYALQDSIDAQRYNLTIGSTTQSCVFTVPSDSRNYSIVLYAGVAGSTAGNSVRWTNIMVQKGNKCTEYQQPAWNRLATTSASMTYDATGTTAVKMLLTNIPVGRCKATMGYESQGAGARTDEPHANSCLVWFKARNTAPSIATDNGLFDYKESVIAVTDWGEEVTLTQKASVAVYGGTKEYIQALVQGTTPVNFSAAGTWTVPTIYILNRKIDEAFAKTAALDYLKAALNSSTEIVGGLTMTNVLMLKNLAGNVTAGMSGLTTKTGTTTADNVLLWGGGTYDEAFAAALSANYYKSGTTPITTLLKKDGTGKIGIFKISDEEVVVDTGDSKTIITTDTIANIAAANNIGYTTLDKTYSSSGTTLTSQARVLMQRTFDGTKTGTISIPYLRVDIGITGSNSLRQAKAVLKITVTYGGGQTATIKNETIFISATNSSSSQQITMSNYSASYGSIESFKIELASDSQTLSGSISVYFNCYVGTAGTGKTAVIAKDGMMVSSDKGGRFIVSPNGNNMSVVADLPIVSTKADVDKLSVGQLFTDSTGIVRRYSIDDDTGGAEREFVSIGYLKNNAREPLSFKQFDTTLYTLTVNSSASFAGSVTMTGLAANYDSASSNALYQYQTYDIRHKRK